MDSQYPSFYSDVEYFRSMYPNSILPVYSKVSDACDKLEYEGSMMFDEFPDKERIFRMIDDIFNLIPPEKHHPHLKEFITVLLVNEMHHRRIRKREF